MTQGATAVQGMGALVFEGGVAFRVWAPNATEVAATGSFCEWADDGVPLAHEADGYWYGQAEGARAGDEYRFVITAADGTRLSRIDPYAAQVTNSVGNGVVYDHSAFDWRGDDFACPPHNEMVVYEMHVGSFATDDDEEGTLEDVRRRLAHFTRLGVNAVQLMPVAEFAGDRSWGYNPAHIFAVESTYGGPDALKRFVREAHRAGIAVILDVVYNHFGPSDLDLWRFDGWGEPDKGGIYFYNDDRSSTPWGDTRPDYGRAEVRRFIRDNALMWLREYHLDGLRFDMTPFMRSTDGMGDDIPDGWSLCRWITDEVRAHHPGRITIAEDLHGDPRVTSNAPDGAGFHAQWDAGFVHPVREAAITPMDEHRSMRAVADAIAATHGDAFSRVIYTESHDEVANGKARLPEEIEGDDPTGWPAQKRSTLAAVLVFTSPGIPMVFQGQEFLEGGWFRDDVPLDWEHNARFRGIVRLYRDLVRLRRNVEGLTRGLTGQHCEVFHVDEERNLVAFHRWADGGPGDDVVVIANHGVDAVADHQITLPHGGTWRLCFNSDAGVYSDLFGDAPAGDLHAPESGDVGVSVGPYSALVYSRAH